MGLILIVVAAFSVITLRTASATNLGQAWITICKNGNVTGSYQFSLNSGSPLIIAAGSCQTYQVEDGHNTVTELPDPATQLSNITISPTADTVSKSVPERTATVNIPSNDTATVTFTNVPLTQVQVCKIAGSSDLQGQAFSYTVTPTGGSPATVTATAGPTSDPGCSQTLSYPSGTQVTIVETGIPSTDQVAITSDPTANCTTTPSTATAVCNLGSSGLTTVTYTNTTEPQVQVCKIAGSSDLQGQTFSYTVTPTGGSPTTVTAKAGPTSDPGCSQVLSYPSGTQVTIVETDASGYTVSIASDPAANCTFSGATATCNLGPTGLTTVTYTNTAEPQVQVCKIAGTSDLQGQTFSYTVTPTGGSPTTVTAKAGPTGDPGCSQVLIYAPGTQVTIVETDASGYTVSIASDPVANCTFSGATATCNLGPTGLTTVTYTNTTPLGPQVQVCKIAGSSDLQGQAFSYTVTPTGGSPATVTATAGPTSDPGCSQTLSYPSGTQVTIVETGIPSTDQVAITSDPTANCTTTPSTATAVCNLGSSGLTTVTYTNTTEPQVQVCKIAGSSDLQGQTFSYTVTPTGGSPTTVTAKAGPTSDPGCSQVLSYPSGTQVTIVETDASGYTVSIASDPAANCTFSGATATCNLGPTGLTTVTYTNTAEPQVQVCKIAGTSDLQGQTFSYTVTPTGGSPTTVTAKAGPTGDPGCSQVLIYAPGTQVTIVETDASGYTVSIASDPVANCTFSGATATCNLGPTGLTTVTYTNTQPSTGWLEVCKVAGDASVTGHSFLFSVNGGPSFPVTAGNCSSAMQVPSGTATVQEIESNPDFYLENVSTVSVTDPTGARLQSGPTADPALVSVPGGGVSNETMVTFTNATVQSAFKICTQQTSPGAELFPVAMPYSYSYTVNGVQTARNVSLMTPLLGATCTLPIGPFVAFNNDGTPVKLSVTAETPPVIAVDLAAFLYQGSGSVTSEPSSFPANFPTTVVVALGPGLQRAHFH